MEDLRKLVGIISDYTGISLATTNANIGNHKETIEIHTPGSMNSLFSDFFREFWRGMSGGVRDYLGEVLGGFYWKNKGK